MRLIAVLLLSVFVLSGCARLFTIEPEDTAGSILLIGVDVSGGASSPLGFYYIFDFVDSEGETYSIDVRPDTNARPIVITELPPGDYTLATFVARANPGVSGYAGTSLRERQLGINFTLEEGYIHQLNQQFTIEHGRDANELRTTNPGFEPLNSFVIGKLNRRSEQLGPNWNRAEERIGEWPEREPREHSGFLRYLFGS